MSLNPNERQVGGSHYKRKVQHWDLMAFARADYFAGQITKYSERHSKKNGREDLEKALHFAEKNFEVRMAREVRRSWLSSAIAAILPSRSPSYDREVAREIRRYAVEAGLTALQERIFECCLLEPHDPEAVVRLCRLHLDREYGEERQQAAYSFLKPQNFGAPMDTMEAQRLMMQEMLMEPGTPEDGGHHAPKLQSIDDKEFDDMLEKSLEDLKDLEETASREA